MRTAFIQTSYGRTKARRMIRREYPWAAIIVTVDGGFIAFESVEDYATWKAQT